MLASLEADTCDAIMTARIRQIENQLNFSVGEQVGQAGERLRPPTIREFFEIRNVVVIRSDEIEIGMTAKSLGVKICDITGTDNSDVHRTFRERLRRQSPNNSFPPFLQLPQFLSCLFRYQGKFAAKYR